MKARKADGSDMSNRDHLTIDQLTGSQRRVRTRTEKLGLAISLLAFFGAIAVIGWFGLSGYQADDGSTDGQARIIFAGGDTRLIEAAPDSGVAAVASDGDSDGFGDPDEDLYADDGGAGDWGAPALDRADSASTGGEPRRSGSIRRGRGSE